jgi:hypothetical protein
VIRARRSEVSACYEGAMAGLGAFDAEVTLDALIGLDGAVVEARFAGDPELQALRCCLERAARRWTFARANSLTRIFYPFRLVGAQPEPEPAGRTAP